MSSMRENSFRRQFDIVGQYVEDYERLVAILYTLKKNPRTDSYYDILLEQLGDDIKAKTCDVADFKNYRRARNGDFSNDHVCDMFDLLFKGLIGSLEFGLGMLDAELLILKCAMHTPSILEKNTPLNGIGKKRPNDETGDQLPL